MSGPTFAMMTCAHGAEAAVKVEMAERGWRLAFSRPGFVTAKHDDLAELPHGTFIRTAARSIGQARDQRASELVNTLRSKLEQTQGNRCFDQLHVWPKDRVPIGRFGFEPGIDEVSRAVGQLLVEQLGEQRVRHCRLNKIAEPGEEVLDVVLVEPAHWFIGCHTAADWPSRWPGGVQPIEPIHEPVSRAYFKAAEAITWSGFEMLPGDLCVEIGSAPGGACGRLLELGMKVIGIDPAEMDPRIASHPDFRHIVARAGDLPRKEFRGVKWMLVDSNVKPDKTLVTVGNIVNNRHTSIRGMLITLKLGDYAAADLIDRWSGVMQSWNPQRIRARQLARNKCEICFAVEM